MEVLIAAVVLFVLVLLAGPWAIPFILNSFRKSEAKSLANRVGELERTVARLASALEGLKKAGVQPAAEAPAKPTVAETVQAAAAAPPMKPLAEMRAPSPPAPPAPAPLPPSPAPLVEQKPAAPVPAVAPAAPKPAPAVPPPVAAATPVTPPERKAFSLEERLGTNWLNKLGVIILVSGVGFFLAYQLTNLGPAGKVTVGILVGVAMLAAGVWLERKERYRILARALIGGGWALLYFVAFAMYYVPAAHVIDSQTADLVLMLAVAAAMVLHTLRYDSQVVTGLAFLLAFGTVTIHHAEALSLAAGAILALGLVVLVLRKQWYELEVFGILAAFLNHFLWLMPIIERLPEGQRLFPEYRVSMALLIFYWAVFRASYVLRRTEGAAQEAVSTVAALLNGALFLGLVKYQAVHPEWAFWFLLGLGAVEFVLGQLPLTRRRRMAFIVLTIIGVSLMVAAVPFRYSGSSVAVLWLVEAEALFLAGLWAREVVFRRMGMLVAGVVTAYLVAVAAMTLTTDYNAPRLGVTLGLAAAVFYLNTLWFGRRKPDLFSAAVDAAALKALSYFGAIAVTTAIGVAASDTWIAAGWLAAALALAAAGRWLKDDHLVLQAIGLSVVGVVRTLAANTQLETAWHSVPMRLLTLGAAAAMLYGMAQVLRPQKFGNLRIAPAFTWPASFLVGMVAWYELRPISVAVAWAVFGLILLELGLALGSRNLRLQGYMALLAALVRIFFVNLNASGAAGEISPRFYTVLPLALIFFYAYARLAASEELEEGGERTTFSTIFAYAGTLTLGALFYFEAERDWVAAGWSGLALALVAVAWRTERWLFLHQGVLVSFAVVLRGLTYNLLQIPYFALSPWHGRTLTTGAAVAGLVAAMAVGFRVRRRDQAGNWLARIFDRRPERTLFFAAVALLTLMLAFVMRSGMITVAWGLEGVGVFLFALWVGERSFRLTGLGLLLFCVGKIGVVDFWALTLRDKWVTLIILGAALMLVSFLYSRHRERFRQYL